jgi:hypothetical protein
VLRKALALGKIDVNYGGNGMAALLRTCIALAFTVMLGASAVWEQPAIADDVLSPLVAIPIASPNPVLGADNAIHFPYEIVLVNMAAGSVSLKKIETLDADSDAVLGTLEATGSRK